MAEVSQIRVKGTLYDIKDAVARLSTGAPATAASVAAMTDTSKIYVYTGSESGYTNGNWYYNNGSSWVSGGVYNSAAVETDTSLSVSGAPADAKVTGDAINNIVYVGTEASDSHTQVIVSPNSQEIELVTQTEFDSEISDLKSQITNSMPREVKLALDAMLLNMVVKDDDVFRDEYNAFHAWATSVNLLSISAVFDSGTDTIYTDDSLDNLKQYLTVTASYDDGTSSAVSGYTLSGELTEGTSQITVSYNDKTASFNVTVVAPLYKVPNLDVTTTYDGRTNHITNTDGLFTISGTGYHVNAIGKNGTAQINHHTEEWFTFNQGDNVVFEVYDITWQNNAGDEVSLACKWGQTTSDSNVATASFAMASGGTGTDGSAKFESNPYTNNRIISGFVIQLSNNKGNGCDVSFRMKLFVNGVRYF